MRISKTLLMLEQGGNILCQLKRLQIKGLLEVQFQPTISKKKFETLCSTITCLILKLNADHIQVTPTANIMTGVLEASNVQSCQRHFTKQTMQFITPTTQQSFPNVQSSTQHYTDEVRTPLMQKNIGSHYSPLIIIFVYALL